MNEAKPGKRKKAAAILTEYRHNSHAEVIVGRLLGRFGYTPSVEIVSMYTDQVPLNDMSRMEAAVFGIPIYPTIADAIGAGGETIDGIVVIGEHGDYPVNERGQKLYPRRMFMEQVLQALDERGLRVPIFADKHLAWDFRDALWIYREIRRRGIPFMGGSSIPFVPLVPDIDPHVLSHPETLLVLSFGDIEAYGFHAMEVMQSLAERRSGGESGIVSVSARRGGEVWQVLGRRGLEHLLDRAFSVYPLSRAGHPSERSKDPVLFEVEYADGLRGYVLQLEEDLGQWSFACRGRGGAVTAARHDSEVDRPFRYFGDLVRHFEMMVMSGQPPFPAERTLLTTGMIDFAMESLFLGRKVLTPELRIRYRPAP